MRPEGKTIRNALVSPAVWVWEYQQVADIYRNVFWCPAMCKCQEGKRGRDWERGGWEREREREGPSSAFVWILSSHMFGEALFAVTLGGTSSSFSPHFILAWHLSFFPVNNHRQHGIESGVQITRPPPFWLPRYLSSNRTACQHHHHLLRTFTWHWLILV